MVNKNNNKETSALDTDHTLVTQSNEIVSQVITMGNGFEITIPDDIEEVKRRLIAAEVTHVLKAVEAGVYYKHLKEKLPPGEYLHFLKSIDVNARRAQEQVAVSELFIKLHSNARAPAHLENNQLKLSQLIELTKLPEEKIAQLDDRDLEEFSRLPYRKLRGVVKQICMEFDEDSKVAAENAKLKHELDELKTRNAEVINDYNHELIKKAPDAIYGLPPLVALVKERAPALTQTIAESSTDLTNLIEKIIQPGLESDHAIQGAKALYHFAIGAHLQLGIALNRLVASFGEETFGDTSALPTYDEQEWHDAEAKREAIIDIHEARFNPKSRSKGRK